MTVQVVPVLRLRRNTTWWSYTVPQGVSCPPGSLVIIPFRGHPCLGVVWNTEADDKATETILESLTQQPLVREPHRRVIESLADYGLCSLSTALYTWLPASLRKLPLSRATRTLLQEYNAFDLTQPAPKQHCVVVPGFRPELSGRLRQKFSIRFSELFQEKESLAVQTWFAIVTGKITVGLGRERAIWAPWINLTQITISDPEDISYYHEQAPYCSLLSSVQDLSTATKAEISYRSSLPNSIQNLLWNTPDNHQEPTLKISLIDLRKEPLMNPALVSGIQAALSRNQTSLLLLNAYDRTRLISKDSLEKTVVPGIETLRKRLAHLLGYTELPSTAVLGSRSILANQYDSVGFAAILSLDPLVQSHTFADLIHGSADIYKLAQYTDNLIIQTHELDHPLVNSLQNNQFTPYLETVIREQKTNHLPPFGELIVCSYPTPEVNSVVLQTYQELENLSLSDWQVGHPYLAPWRKRPYAHIILHASSQTRVPLALRNYVASLPSPWKIQRNPWYLI